MELTELTVQRLRELVSYDPDTGRFTNSGVIRHTRCREGDECGFIDSDGYRKIKIGGRRYKAHHLAFLYMTGALPSMWVDHKNRVRDDNRWKNLREVTGSENALNRSVQTRKQFTKHVGIYWRKDTELWASAIRVAGKLLHLGYFSAEESALEAYSVAKMKYFGV